jgi:H+-translocating NAD(P) transhydrogenase subunit beta
VSEPTWVQLAYLAAAVCFILALKGLSSPRTARAGNLVGAAGAVLAVATVMVSGGLQNVPLLGAAMAVGTGIGVPDARRIAMTAMPQLVALFNGVGGAAAALVALVDFLRGGREQPGVAVVAVAFTLLVGAVSFTGSLVTFLKLQELMTTRPVVFVGLREAIVLGAAAAFMAGVLVLPTRSLVLAVALAVLGCALGVLLVLPVGGADVPIVISLLNAFTGLTVAASGYVLGNTLLLVAGTLVGASGTLLTRMMAAAMGRSVIATMFGGLTVDAAAGEGARGSERPVRSAHPEDVAILLGYARKVVVVPGYGLAVAQAQHALRELADLLIARGVDVTYAIHPVAGRMPGHMNVLLAEAEVPYEQLREMDDVNPEFARTNVALVVGANDVVNPAARSSQGSPIYGMPILDVDQAEHVVFLKRSMRPGFAGIDNDLLYSPKTTLLFGDAKESLFAVVQAVKNL